MPARKAAEDPNIDDSSSDEDPGIKARLRSSPNKAKKKMKVGKKPKKAAAPQKQKPNPPKRRKNKAPKKDYDDSSVEVIDSVL